MFKNALVVGCSYANGHGLNLDKHRDNLWAESLLKTIGVDEIDNLSQSGWNNQSIFLEASIALTKKNYDIAIVAWSETARFNFNFGLELYKTRSHLTDTYDINLHTRQTVTKKYQQEAGDMLRKYLNYHWSILDLIKYVNILLALKSKNLFFVNSIGVWSDGFFDKKNFIYPNELSHFEQDLLSVEFRSDNDVHELYNYIHSQYQYYGGINAGSWLNLYNPLHRLRIDQVSDSDSHP